MTYWRDARAGAELHRRALLATAASCSIRRRECARECGTKDNIEKVKLSRKGNVYTYTLDHLAGGQYLNVPIPRLVIDLEGGGRVFLEMTDGDPNEVKIGLPVEVLFRRLHEGAELPQLLLEGRPLPQAAS